MRAAPSRILFALAAAVVTLTGCSGAVAPPPQQQQPPPPVKLQIDIAGSGTVTGAGALSCTASCATTVDGQATATLRAAPAPGFVFAGWSGDCSGMGVCTVQTNRDLHVSAAFALARTLTVTVGGTGRGAVTSIPSGISCPGVCTAQFPAGAEVALAAAPAAGSLLGAWSGSCATSGASCKATLGSDGAVAATFTLAPRVLTVSLQGAGSVRSVPAGIACPGACTSSFPAGAAVRLVAAATADQVFAGWSGACAGATCALTLANDAAVVAAFAAPPPPRVLGNWTFYGPEQGAPTRPLGVAADAGGNLWVAGGEEGLFVLRPGAHAFQRFTMDDGLRPYGFMPDGSAPPGDKYLKVISVAGGPDGTVFAGYEGKPPGPGQLGCEDNWDGPDPDPSIYKSGDADRVTLSGAGIAVVHYDIFSGPGMVPHEQRGREKLCNILRIVYDPGHDAVWFGGNHGFAMGRASYEGDPSCNGQRSCSGVLEHVHPALNAWSNDARASVVYLTGEYHGVAVDPLTRDVWFGGANRTTRFKYATTGGNYFAAQSLTEDAPYASNRIDVWPDRVQEPDYPRPSDRVDDLVSGIAASSDGSAWVASYAHGLAHLDNGGAVLGYVDRQLPSTHVSAIASDPKDGSIWVGYWYDGGVSRLSGGSVSTFGAADLGPLAASPVLDLAAQGAGSARRILAAFQNGAVGVYAGP